MNGQLMPYRFVAPSGRRYDYLLNYTVRCPDGHHIPDLLGVDESGYVGCNKSVGDSRSRGQFQPHCQKWSYIFLFRNTNGHLMFEVSRDERAKLRQMPGFADRIEYLLTAPLPEAPKRAA